MVSHNRTITIILIVVAVILTATLSISLCSCDKKNEEPVKKEAADYLQELLADFDRLNTVAVAGKITFDTETDVRLVFDKADKIIDLTYGNNVYHYEDSTLFMLKESEYVIQETGTNFTRVIKNVPFSLATYVYDPDRFYSVDYDGDNVVVSFYKRGVVTSFNSDMDAAGGSFIFVVEEGKIKSTVLDTVVTDNGKKKKYRAEYAYSVAEPTRNVTVAPSDDLNYANYAITEIDLHNQGKTIHTRPQDYDLGVTVKSIPLQAASISKVFCIKTGNYVSLNILYSTPVVITMVHASVESLQITYDENFAVTQIIINDNNRYVLI